MQASDDFGRQVAAGDRFEFGSNWASFLAHVDDERIERAVFAVRTVLSAQRFDGKTFLDIGCGSGLFSLAARRLGARVTSFDFDPKSVACAAQLKQREGTSDDDWLVLRGSALDEDFLCRLGSFDIVYSWGVLHHTGSMWVAIENAQRRVKPGGLFCLAIYNDQGRGSRIWLKIKQLYNRLPYGLKWIIALPALVRTWGCTFARDLLSGSPFRHWRDYVRDRGMSPWHDLKDWVGGLPFEVATPEAIFEFLSARGFRLTYLKTCAGGIGCNEYTFIRIE